MNENVVCNVASALLFDLQCCGIYRFQISINVVIDYMLCSTHVYGCVNQRMVVCFCSRMCVDMYANVVLMKVFTYNKGVCRTQSMNEKVVN